MNDPLERAYMMCTRCECPDVGRLLDRMCRDISLVQIITRLVFFHQHPPTRDLYTYIPLGMPRHTKKPTVVCSIHGDSPTASMQLSLADPHNRVAIRQQIRRHLPPDTHIDQIVVASRGQSVNGTHAVDIYVNPSLANMIDDTTVGRIRIRQVSIS